QGVVVERRHEAEKGMAFGPRHRAESLDVVHHVFVSTIVRAPARHLSVARSDRDDEDREERPALLVEKVGSPSRLCVGEPGADEVDARRRLVWHRHAEPGPPAIQRAPAGRAPPRRRNQSSTSPRSPDASSAGRSICAYVMCLSTSWSRSGAAGRRVETTRATRTAATPAAAGAMSHGRHAVRRASLYTSRVIFARKS